MLDPDQFIQQLGQVRHFQGLPEVDLKAIVQAGQTLRFPNGAALFEEGAPCSGMFVLILGTVHLCKSSLQGRETILAEISPVIMFNEVAVIDGGPNPVTARAAADCLTWQVGYERFQVLLTRYPQVGSGLLRVLATRNRLLISQHEAIASRTVHARLAHQLLELSQAGDIRIDRQLHTNLELAARTSTVPEAISRALRWMSTNDLISLNRKAILILQPMKLVELADSIPGRIV
jgi:CRP/FNR family transcriptional regulator, cyclic AMP receptor protein